VIQCSGFGHLYLETSNGFGALKSIV
jgi:hypothetical protein